MKFRRNNLKDQLNRLQVLEKWRFSKDSCQLCWQGAHILIEYLLALGIEDNKF